MLSLEFSKLQKLDADLFEEKRKRLDSGKFRLHGQVFDLREK